MDPDPLLLSSILSGFYFIGLSIAPLPLILFLICLLIGSALISASEVAYFSLSPKDIEELEKEDSKGSKRVLQLKESPRDLLATILISNNLINIAIVIFGELLLRQLFSAATFDQWAQSAIDKYAISFISAGSLSSFFSYVMTVVAVTFLLVLFGEVAPKIYANIHNIKHAKLMGRPLHFLSNFFYPITKLLLGWSGGIEENVYRRRLMINSETDKKEIDKAIELTVSNNESKEEVDILKGIIKFGDVETKQIMKSRVDVVGIEKNEGFKEVMQLIKSSGFSRFPVYEEDFDKILGILYVKDLLGLTQENDSFDWLSLVRNNVLYAPETKKIDELLKEIQLKRTHMAIVVDEYGGSSGIVTLEDIMEEVVGDIKDEFDHEEEVEYEKIDDHTYIFEGKSLLNDVTRVLNLDNDFFDEGRGGADSLAGLILEIEGMIPKRERAIAYKNLRLTATKSNKRRIEKVKVQL